MLPFLFGVPLVVDLIFFVTSKHFCWKEFTSLALVAVLMNVLGVALSFAGETRDREVRNGRIEGKSKDRVSCEHSYPCRCRTVSSGSGKSRTSHTKCDTCYEHTHDFDWNVQSSIENFEIDRIDRQGVNEPPRWTEVKKGEPAYRDFHYTNYIKAAPGSVLRMDGQGDAFKAILPAYPMPYDYYRYLPIVPVGEVFLPNFIEATAALDNLNARLGDLKQVHVLMVVVKVSDQDFFHALEQHWLGGKKNDLIIVLGTSDGDKIEWARVMTWSKVELLKVKLRDEALKAGSLKNLVGYIQTADGLISKHFERRPMDDFKYLRYQYSPSPGIMIFLLILGIITSLGLSYYFVHNDPFESGFGRRRYSGSPRWGR